jgi:hypothetical protein
LPSARWRRCAPASTARQFSCISEMASRATIFLWAGTPLFSDGWLFSQQLVALSRVIRAQRKANVHLRGRPHAPLRSKLHKHARGFVVPMTVPYEASRRMIWTVHSLVRFTTGKSSQKHGSRTQFHSGYEARAILRPHVGRRAPRPCLRVPRVQRRVVPTAEHRGRRPRKGPLSRVMMGKCSLAYEAAHHSPDRPRCPFVPMLA